MGLSVTPADAGKVQPVVHGCETFAGSVSGPLFNWAPVRKILCRNAGQSAEQPDKLRVIHVPTRREIGKRCFVMGAPPIAQRNGGSSFGPDQVDLHRSGDFAVVLEHEGGAMRNRTRCSQLELLLLAIETNEALPRLNFNDGGSVEGHAGGVLPRTN